MVGRFYVDGKKIYRIIMFEGEKSLHKITTEKYSVHEKTTFYLLTIINFFTRQHILITFRAYFFILSVHIKILSNFFLCLSFAFHFQSVIYLFKQINGGKVKRSKGQLYWFLSLFQIKKSAFRKKIDF